MAVSFAESVYNQDDDNIVRSGVVTSVFDGARGHEYAANDQDYFASEDRYVQVQDDAHDDSHQDVEDLFLEAGQTSDRDRAVNLVHDGQIEDALIIAQLTIENTNFDNPHSVGILAEFLQDLGEAFASKGSEDLDDLLVALLGAPIKDASWLDLPDGTDSLQAAEERSRALQEHLEQKRISAVTHVPQGYQPEDAAPKRKVQAPTYALFTPPSPSF